MGTPTIYSAFWFFGVLPSWWQLGQDCRADAVAEFADYLDQAAEVTLRGSYELAGFRHDADLLVWVHGEKLEAIQSLAVDLRRSALGRHSARLNTLLGLVRPSQYVHDHMPAFTRGVAPRTYLSVYPFVKSHDWYQIPFEERRRIMMEHGVMGKPFQETVLTNTIYSYGLTDDEFVVAFESEEPLEIVNMIEALRPAKARIYTVRDTPIVLGARKPIAEILDSLI